eukprot:scaffold2354_cov124-Isochrysis_galbana.AAC.9
MQHDGADLAGKVGAPDNLLGQQDGASARQYGPAQTADRRPQRRVTRRRLLDRTGVLVDGTEPAGPHLPLLLGRRHALALLEGVSRAVGVPQVLSLPPPCLATPIGLGGGGLLIQRREQRVRHINRRPTVPRCWRCVLLVDRVGRTPAVTVAMAVRRVTVDALSDGLGQRNFALAGSLPASHARW